MFSNDFQQVIISGGFWVILLVLAILPTLLGIVLFFKIWGMTNDVANIKDQLKEWMDIEHPYIDKDGKEVEVK